jgi:hypothetical protein
MNGKNSFFSVFFEAFHSVSSQRAFTIEMMILWLKNVKRNLQTRVVCIFDTNLWTMFTKHMQIANKNDRRALTAPHIH